LKDVRFDQQEHKKDEKKVEYGKLMREYDRVNVSWKGEMEWAKYSGVFVLVEKRGCLTSRAQMLCALQQTRDSFVAMKCYDLLLHEGFVV
jgi:hypothetical protein